MNIFALIYITLAVITAIAANVKIKPATFTVTALILAFSPVVVVVDAIPIPVTTPDHFHLDTVTPLSIVEKQVTTEPLVLTIDLAALALRSVSASSDQPVNTTGGQMQSNATNIYASDGISLETVGKTAGVSLLIVGIFVVIFSVWRKYYGPGARSRGQSRNTFVLSLPLSSASSSTTLASTESCVEVPASNSERPRVAVAFPPVAVVRPISVSIPMRSTSAVATD